jgi:hypothetical protein
MNFTTGLQVVDGFDCITTFVDSFTKHAHFKTCSIHINAPQLARLFLDKIYRHHGLCQAIITDRDPKFSPTFWQTIIKSKQTKLLISSSYHPETDGLTKNTHRIQSNKYSFHLFANNITIDLTVYHLPNLHTTMQLIPPRNFPYLQAFTAKTP